LFVLPSAVVRSTILSVVCRCISKGRKHSEASENGELKVFGSKRGKVTDIGEKCIMRSFTYDSDYLIKDK
jgi:hypothetical protein